MLVNRARITLVTLMISENSCDGSNPDFDFIAASFLYHPYMCKRMPYFASVKFQIGAFSVTLILAFTPFDYSLSHIAVSCILFAKVFLF